MGADINAAGKNLETPLFHTLRSCGVNVLKVATHLIAKGASVESRDSYNITPLMEAIHQGQPLVVQGLLDANADAKALDIFGRSPLYFAATKPPPLHSKFYGIFASLMSQGLNAHALDEYGGSAFHRACFLPSLLPLLLNMDIALEDSKPIQWEGIDMSWFKMFSNFLRVARRKYKQDTLREFINLVPDNAWSPLCKASSAGVLSLMDDLLGFGAQLDSDGCPLGSAMMAACDAGRKNSVIFLTRRGAALSYSSPSGFRSAYIAAQKFPDILHWLLVDRFTDQSKLTATPDDSDGLDDHAENDLPYTCCGPEKAELVITGRMERNPKESSLAYWIRLMAEKRSWRGKVVPTIPGRRTTHPLNLVPQEHVRIHPDGYEVKKGEGVDG